MAGRERTHETVVRHVQGELEQGRLHVGGRLPAERSLAEQLNVSRPSVREGIRVLEAMGLIRTAVGSGPDSGATIIADTASGITSALRLHLASSSLPVSDVVRTRVLLESWSVAEAARRADRAAQDECERLLEAMDSPSIGVGEFLQLDAYFHVALAQAAGNDVVTAIMTSLRDAIHDYVARAVPALPDWPAMQQQLRREHRAIALAVRDGDGERAARLVTEHIEGFYGATNVAATNVAATNVAATNVGATNVAATNVAATDRAAPDSTADLAPDSAADVS